MPETRVYFNRGDDGPLGELAIRINCPDETFHIAVEKIAANAVAHVDDLLLDLLDIAASIFAADGSVTRGGATRQHFGAGWRRRLQFTIPLRAPSIWQHADVIAALTDAVGFLTDDDVTFTFEGGRVDTANSDYFDFDVASSDAFRLDEVALFSGGLDSLAGALEALTVGTGRVALVTHLSAPKIEAHQRRLAKALSERFGGRVLFVPVRATRKGPEARETTQRSRSFLFAALGFVIARMFGAKRISFFENGVVSHNLPFSPQVIGTMATRTTHPLTLRKFDRLFGLLGGEAITIENRFAWATKADIVARIADHDAADLIRDTVSCTNVRDQSVLHTHCGSCSQCLDRRFAILAVGLDASDPEEMYQTDVLSGPRPTNESRTLALDWTLHACRVAQLSLQDFFGRFASETVRIIEGYPDRPEIDIAREVHALQRRHGENVRQVLVAQVIVAAPDLLDRNLPATSLLRMVLAQQGHVLALPILLPTRPPSTEAMPEPDNKALDIFPLQVAFDMRGGIASVQVKGLGEVRGVPAVIAHFLRVTHDEDRASGLSRERFRFVRSGNIARGCVGSKGAVWKNVNRCHQKLAEFYRVVENKEPPRALLIDTKRQHGYRLDPTMMVIDISQV